jgi:peptide chain release factor 1
MNQSIIDKLETLVNRLEELNHIISLEGATDDIESFKKNTIEIAEITPIVELFNKFKKNNTEITELLKLLDDDELKVLANDEIKQKNKEIIEIELDLQKALIPKDPDDNKSIFLEIRAGTGGDESALFAGDLFKMYSKFSEEKKWKVEIISQSLSDLGGFKEVVAKISGQQVYSKLKFESGGHRVQRVPDTETQGRIHTSACTVAIMPEADDIEDIQINPSDLRIDTFRASGAGGQHVNKTDSAVRITHLPTGIVVECQDDRSQHKNKANALSVLAARIKDEKIKEQRDSEASTRKLLVGSGDRSERIRTYNFPQGRVTDHRINLTLYKLSEIMEGRIDEIITSLINEQQANLLAEISS